MLEITRSTLVLFGFEVHWYGLLIALGVLAAVLLASRREARLGFPRDTSLNVALICVPAAILCARIYYVLFSWPYYAAHPGEILDLRRGGLAIYGGVIGGVLAGWAYCRIKKLSFMKGLDLIAPSLALGQAIGRWGNFLNQEAYGRAVSHEALRFFPLAVRIGETWHYAAFFYESAWCLLIVLFILAAERRQFFRRSGDIFGAYVLLYGLERALVEGLRTDSLYLGPIRISQLVSLLAVLSVLLMLLRREGSRLLLRIAPVAAWAVLAVLLFMDAGPIVLIPALLVLLFAGLLYTRSQT